MDNCNIRLLVISLMGLMSMGGVCGFVDPQQLTLSKPLKSVTVTVSGGGGGSTTSNRPIQPSHSLPVMDLIESPDKMYDPNVEDIDIRVMLEKMGKNYDSRFMSWRRPLDSILKPNGTVELSLERNSKGQWVPRGKMPDDIKRLKFKNWSSTAGGRLNSKLRRKMRQFLWTFTYCPVIHVWKDLGIRFWPRWLREGQCYSRQSCSLPTGMSCKPNKSENKTVLRWHCQDWDKASYCKWIPIKYPVVVQCTCSC